MRVCFAVDSRLKDHFTLVGKLDGVAELIEENLADAARISLEVSGHVLADDAADLNTLLLGLEPNQFDGLLNGCAQVKIDHLKIQLPCIDLREIENIVDDGEEVLAQVNRLAIFLLFGG